MALVYYLLVCFSLLGFVYALTWFFGVYVPSRRGSNLFIDAVDRERKRCKCDTRRDDWLK